MIEDVKAAAEHMKAAMGLLAKGPLDFYLTELSGAYEYMMKRFCPLQVGDRVALIKFPKIDEDHAPGWAGAKHFLFPGAMGKVSSAKCRPDGFCFGVVFDDESYIYNGETKPVSSKHVFNFGESFLVKVSQGAGE